MKSVDNIKLIQCYHCWQYSHTKSNCPRKKEPKLCPRCGEIGHNSYQCENDIRCIHCEGTHPATARICVAYKQKFAEVMRDLTAELLEFQKPVPKIASVSPPSPGSCKSNACQAIISAFNASYLPDGFLTSLYGILQTTTPKKTEAPPILAYDCELDQSIISAPQEGNNSINNSVTEKSDASKISTTSKPDSLAKSKSHMQTLSLPICHTTAVSHHGVHSLRSARDMQKHLASLDLDLESFTNETDARNKIPKISPFKTANIGSLNNLRKK